MAGRKQSDRSRKRATEVFGRSDGLTHQEAKEIRQSKEKTTQSNRKLDRIFDVIARNDRTPGGLPVPDGVRAADVDIMHRLYQTATRDNTELPAVYCPKCKTLHHDALYIKCPVHGDDYPLLFPKIPAEKNSIAAAKILADKRFAQKQTITGNLEVKSVSVVMIKGLVGVMQKYIPRENMPAAQKDIDKVLREMERLEVED